MTIALNGVTVDTGPVAPSTPSLRAQASLLATLGANNVQAAARVQLPSAVAASTAVASLPAQVPTPPRQVVRVPSSPLAAQFIAQDTGLSAQDLEIFAVRQTLTQANVPEAQVDDYLSALRIARGDVPTARQNPANSGSNPTQEKIDTALRDAASQANAPLATAQATARSGVAALATGLPALTPPLLRRVNFASSKGADAYQIAQQRNAGLKRVPGDAP